MSDSGEYAIVDVTRGSDSAGKILVLLDNEGQFSICGSTFAEAERGAELARARWRR